MDAIQSVTNAIFLGHNVIITGQAGTGKTCLIKKLYFQLKNSGKHVKVVATTGIASTLLPDASTVHSFFGLSDGRYNNSDMLKKMSDDNFHDVKERIERLEVLFIDEISFLSRHVLEMIETICRHVCQEPIPFGGIQVIMSGDFYQLKPVPNKYGDMGEYMFHSALKFHRFTLHTVYRQSEGSLIKAVHETSRGKVSTETELFLKRMKRNLPPGEPPVKLFARNFDVDKYNSDKLMDMNGEPRVYRAIDAGDTKQLTKCNVNQLLHLKLNAPVMLIVNLTGKLVNGLCGVVNGLKADSVFIFFQSIDKTVKISPYQFSVYSCEKGKDIASRLQFPLKLAFAITTHKAQGLTLKRIEIDCRQMNNPGQIGVAIGRACEVKGLRVLNFSKHLVNKHNEEVYTFYTEPFLELSEDLGCCHKNLLVDEIEEIEQKPQLETEVEMSSESDNENSDNDQDQDLTEDLHAIEMIDQLISIEEIEANELEHPLSADVSVEGMLSGLRYDKVITQEQLQLNNVLSDLITNQEHVKLFADRTHDKMYSMFLETIPQIEPVENKHTTAFYKKVTLYMSSDDYIVDVKSFFNSPSKVQYRVAFGIAQKIRSLIISKAAEPLFVQAREEAKTKTKPLKDSKGSRAKVRYIGGWCIATLRYRKGLLVTRNLYKLSVKHNVDKWHAEIRILEQLEMHDLSKEQKDESLVEIQRKKNINSSLTVLSDKAFHFFINLDNNIQKLETAENINIHGKSFYSYISSEIHNSQDLIACWKRLFFDEDEFKMCDNVEYLDSLLLEIIAKYLKMSSGQFRHEYKKELNIQKEEAHRKQIRMKDRKKHERQRITYDAMFIDNSDLKLVSHLSLRSEVLVNSSYLSLFTKEHLKNLCEAYDVVFISKMKKNDLVTLLTSKISETEIMPHPEKLGPKNSSSGMSEPTASMGRRKIIIGKGKKKQTSGTVLYPCGVCKGICEIDCVCCDLCDTWYHFTCITLTGEEDAFQGDADWFCNICKK